MSRRWFWTIVVAALLSLVAKVQLAYRTYGSTDILVWEADSRKLQTESISALYREGIALDRGGEPRRIEFNHPPFMLRMLTFWASLESASGLPLRFWLRLSSALGDIAGVLLLLGIVRRSKSPPRPQSLLLVALSPVSLMVSGFHGNTDPLMVALLLLAVYLLVSERPCWLAGAALGMAMSFKIVPLVFAPAIFFFVKGWWKRLHLVLGAAAVFLLASSPWILRNPRMIWEHVFGYTPQSGGWGAAMFALIWISEKSFPLYVGAVKSILLGVMLISGAWMNLRQQPRPPVELQLGFLTFLFLAITPGFGVQYLVWLVPWTGLLSVRHALPFHVASGLFLFSYYDRASQGSPWYLANSVATPVWYGSVLVLGLLCWLTVCWLTVVFWRHVRDSI